MNMPLEPVVAVPADEEMADEPAQAVGKAMQVKNAIFLLLTAAGYSVSTQVDGAVVDLITVGTPAVLLLWSFVSTWWQARQTRSAVYSPTTTAKFAKAENVRVIRGNPEEAITG